MQDQIAARNLAVERGVRIEPVVPIDGEAEEPKIKFIRFPDIENAQDRDDGAEGDLHDASLDDEQAQPPFGAATAARPSVAWREAFANLWRFPIESTLYFLR
jgi:hypothetical protein